MIICICNRISDREIRSAIQEHSLTTLEELQYVMDVCTNCEKCKEAILELLEQDTKDTGS